MPKKTDLIKLFGLEGVIEPRAIRTLSKDEVMRKTAYEMSLEIKDLMDELTGLVSDQDIDTVIDTLKAANLRLECMTEIANRMKILIDKSRKK